MCQSTSMMETATVSCSGSILSALHPLRSSTNKRLNQPRPRWSRRESTEKKKNGWSLPGNVSGLRVNWVTAGGLQCRRAGAFFLASSSAGCAIAHWRDASIEKTIIVVANSSWCLLCAMLKIALCSKNRNTTQNCAEADVIVTGFSCKETVLLHIFFIFYCTCFYL